MSGAGEFPLAEVVVQTGIRAADVEALAEILVRSEGYTAGEASSLSDIRSDLARFVEDDRRSGIIVRRPGAGVQAFILHRFRSKRLETFEAGNPIATLADDLFPRDGRFIQIHDLWVDASLRRRGAATWLKQRLEVIARADGIAAIYTVTEAAHVSALRLNEKLGYRAVFQGPMWDSVERIALIKRLD